MYIVLIDFTERDDGSHVYRKGEGFPRKGYAPDEARITCLLSKENGLHQSVIEEKPAPKGRKSKDDEGEGAAE